MVVIGNLRHTQEGGAMTAIHANWPFVIATILVAIGAAIPVAMVYLVD
jgi:hypothetical protein